MSDKPIPQPNCPSSLRVKDHVPMAHVNNVDQSIEFYTLLGFSCSQSVGSVTIDPLQAVLVDHPPSGEGSYGEDRYRLPFGFLDVPR